MVVVTPPGSVVVEAGTVVVVDEPATVVEVAGTVVVVSGDVGGTVRFSRPDAGAVVVVVDAPVVVVVAPAIVVVVAPAIVVVVAPDGVVVPVVDPRSGLATVWHCNRGGGARTPDR